MNLLFAMPTLEFIIVLVPLLIGLIIFLAALIDCLRSKFTKSNKIVWLLVILLVPYIGPLLYLFIGRKQKIKK